jgi:hypothetical protein
VKSLQALHRGDCAGSITPADQWPSFLVEAEEHAKANQCPANEQQEKRLWIDYDALYSSLSAPLAAMTSRLGGRLDENPLDLIERQLVTPAVIELGGAG